jgi:hypothetical protein
LSSSWSSLRSHGGGDTSSIRTAYDDPALGGKAIARDQARELLGQVMGYVAVAVGFAALGAYLGRDLSGGTGLVLFIGAFACILGLNIGAAKGREQLAIGLLFGQPRLTMPIHEPRTNPRGPPTASSSATAPCFCSRTHVRSPKTAPPTSKGAAAIPAAATTARTSSVWRSCRSEKSSSSTCAPGSAG